MRREIGANGIRMPYVQQTGGNPFQTKLFDQMFWRIQGHVAQMDLVLATLIKETGDQRPDLAGTEDEHTMHHETLYSTLEF
jgi:hypothetical protein